MRLTRKPGQSRTTIGVLPIRLARATSVTTVASLVCSPRITSTSCMRSTGLKKCMPAKFSGRATALAMRVIEMVEVFEARMASGWQNRLRARGRACTLAASFSTMASMTTSRSARA